MLGYRATPDFVVDASRAMTMEQLIEDIFDMRGSGIDFQLTVDLLTPGRAIYMEEFRGRQAEFLRGVEFRNSVILPIFRAEAVIIKEVVLVAFLGRVFQLAGEALLEFLGFLARTRGGAAVIEILATELRAFLLSAQLRIGPVVGDAVLLIAEIGRVVAVVLLTVLQYLLMVVHIVQTLVEAIPAVGGMVNAAFELFLSALDALIDLIEADEMLEQAGLVANAGVPESDDPTMTEFLAAWSEPLTE
jgi:hypothetical protein